MKKQYVTATIVKVEFDGATDDILFISPESGKTSHTCTKCGELFVVNWENPKIEGLGLKQIAGEQCCPKCASKLENTLANYPDTFVSKDGSLVTFSPSKDSGYSDHKSGIFEMWELEPDQ